ncbi:MAG TPA: FAD-dependent oxidoreductase, partial [Micromonosporaceae bacterium]
MATRRTSSSRAGGHRIVVLGGGYSGVMAAKLAVRLPGAEVTLVNVRDHFVERVRMHQFASGQRLPERPLADLVRDTGVRLVIDRVEAIDPARRQVRLRGGVIDYDLLIYALGSQADLESVPGVAEHAYTVASVDEAARLGRRLADARVVAVVGAGLTGLETSTELAERRPELTVTLITGA